jgi:SAM-dependent methyltransferase
VDGQQGNGADSPGPAVEPLNVETWRRANLAHAYGGRELRPAEVLLMVRFREHFAGRVLELGCGGGRLTGYLTALAREVWAIDISPAMLAACRARYPSAQYAQGDAAQLDRFDDQRFDLVIAGYNLLDVYGDATRRQALREIRRVLAPGGLLIMSSHNRAYVPRIRRPWEVRVAGLLRGSPRGALELAADVVRAPRRMSRHRRLRRLELSTPEFALVSDGSHEFTLVHYFISVDAQLRQFSEIGLEPVLCSDLDGHELNRDHQAPDCPEIHYVARRPAAARVQGAELKSADSPAD